MCPPDCANTKTKDSEAAKIGRPTDNHIRAHRHSSVLAARMEVLCSGGQGVDSDSDVDRSRSLHRSWNATQSGLSVRTPP